MKRIVITGLGLITSIGDSVNKTWNNLLLCKSGIKKITAFDTSDLPCKIAGHILKNSGEENFLMKMTFLKRKKLIEMIVLYNMD